MGIYRFNRMMVRRTIEKPYPDWILIEELGYRLTKDFAHFFQIGRVEMCLHLSAVRADQCSANGGLERVTV